MRVPSQADRSSRQGAVILNEFLFNVKIKQCVNESGSTKKWGSLVNRKREEAAQMDDIGDLPLRQGERTSSANGRDLPLDFRTREGRRRRTNSLQDHALVASPVARLRHRLSLSSGGRPSADMLPEPSAEHLTPAQRHRVIPGSISSSERAPSV